MSQNPEFPDAHPTAPGGMSKPALRKELIEKHGYTKPVAMLWTWPELIDKVAEERRNREREAEEFATEILGPVDGQGNTMFIGMPDSKDFIFDGHAGAGPSGAERWMNCTASLAAAREFLETLSPNQQAEFAKGSSAALQGTTAHAAAEVEARVILGELTQREADATLLELAIMPNSGEEYNDEMAEYIVEYVDLVKSYVDSGRTVLIEQRVSAVVPLAPLAHYDGTEVHEITGSGDCIVLPSEEEPVLVVGDLKYGEGIDVDVEHNPQIRIYALGALALLVDDEGCLTVDVERIDYHIIQPRLGGIKTWSESVEDLLTWRDEHLSPALSLALAGPEGGATYNPGELQCQWCPARGGCAALAEDRLTSARDLFDTIVEAEFADGPGAFPETASLTDTRLGELLTQIMGLIDIRDDLKEEVQRRLHRGGTVPGFKLVSYTPARKWVEQATEELSDSTLPEVWAPQKLLTPTQALKVVGDDEDTIARLTELIIVPDKRPIVAPENDRRKTWEGKPPEQMFDVEED